MVFVIVYGFCYLFNGIHFHLASLEFPGVSAVCIYIYIYIYIRVQPIAAATGTRRTYGQTGGWTNYTIVQF